MGLVLQLPMSTKSFRTGLKKNQGGWSDVHEDILSLIKARLCYIDQLRFNSVCKGWRSVSYAKPADKWPWILGLGRLVHVRLGRELHVQSYNLYDPSNNKEYFIGHKISNLPKETAPGPVKFRVYASKHGWVFLAATSKITGNRHLFLHHAFTMKTIDLPDIKTSGLDPGKGAFSAIPTCSNCVFYVVDQSFGTITLWTYRNGDVKWSMYKCSNLGNGCVEDVLYRNGLFYCLFGVGLLWAFDIVCGDWRQIPIDASHITNLGAELARWNAMVESDGEILLVYYHRDTKPWYIFSLDWSLMAWTKVDALSNCAIFLGDASMSVSTSDEIKTLAGHIYVLDGNCRPYCYNFNNNDTFETHFPRLPEEYVPTWVSPS